MLQGPTYHRTKNIKKEQTIFIEKKQIKTILARFNLNILVSIMYTKTTFKKIILNKSMLTIQALGTN